MHQICFKPGQFFVIVAILISTKSFAQSTSSNYNSNGSNSTAIGTATPFLNISPNARSGAMGDAGVATPADANSTYWNPAKLNFLPNSSSAILTYSPWLRNLVSDISLAYLSYALKIDDRSSIGFSMRYFNLGSIELYDNNVVSQGTYRPNEFSLDGSYARKFGDDFSMALTFRYIQSNLYSGSAPGTEQANSGRAFATDISLFSTRQTELFNDDATFAYGVHISNIGNKIAYFNNGPQYFLPANIKVGVSNTLFLNDFNKLTMALDLNKLLVPTPPVRDSNGNIIKGRNDNRSVVSGIIGSFTDAPGGFKEELQEISYAAGVEYWYNDRFALRAGYFYENPNKGNRQFLTMGVGFNIRNLNFDFSYLTARQEKSPLANTLRFSLGYTFGKEDSITQF